VNKKSKKLITHHNYALIKSHYGADIQKLSEELLEIVSEIKQLEGDKLANTNVEKYRYILLPKLFSDFKAINSSSKLKRYLVSYYIKNRRKERMQSKKQERSEQHWLANNHLSVDYFIHRMYMELGQVMYFSLLNKLYAKWTDLSNGLAVIFDRLKVSFRVLAKQIALKSSFKRVLSAIIVAFFEVFMIVPKKAKSSILNPTYIGVSLIHGTMLVVLSMLMATLAALSIEQDKDNNNKLNEENEISLIAQVYAHGYAVVESIMSSLEFLLPEKYRTERPEELIPLAHQLVEDIKHKEIFADILLGIAQKFSKMDADFGILDCFELYSGFGKLVTKVKSIEKVSCKIEYVIIPELKDIINKAGAGIFTAPKTITLQEFTTSDKEVMVDPTNFLEPEGNKLPGIIEMIAFLTTHTILIEASVNDGEAKVELIFNAKKYLEKYTDLKISEIVKFAESYLKYYRFLLERESASHM
jgi:hypothetical protein